MIVFVMLFIILSISFGVKIRLKISQEEGILLAVFGMGILTYLLGLVGLLGISIYVILILSIISLIYTIIKLAKKQTTIKELITLPTVIYILVIIFIYYIVKDLKFIDYDEFMFWGTNLKVMFEKSYLWANHLVDGIHLVYPPFTAIIEYIFCKFNGVFNEGVAYFGMITLILTSLIPLFKNEKYSIKSLLRIILMIISTYIAIVLFVYNIANLSVDCILGILFAVSMVLAYKQKDKKDYIALTILLISLTLTKTNGILFAGIVIMQLFFKEVFLIIKDKEKNIKNIAKRLSIILILLVTIVFSYATWKIYYTINGKQVDDRHDKNYIQNINLQEFTNAILQNDKASDRNKKIVTDFFNDFANKKIIRKYDFNSALCIFSLINIIFFIYLIIDKEKLKNLSNFISINIGLLLYIITNLIIFMFVFQETQGETLQGFERYISTYMLAMTLNLIYILLEKVNWRRIILVYLIAIYMQLELNRLMLDPRVTFKVYSNIGDIRIINNANKIQQLVKEDEKVYIIDYQKDYGLEFVKTRYYISPIKTNLLYEWNIGANSLEDVFYRTVISQEDLINKLVDENYDYMYVISIDKQFIEDYKDIFSQEAINKIKTVIIKEQYGMSHVSQNGILLKVNKGQKIIESI